MIHGLDTGFLVAAEVSDRPALIFWNSSRIQANFGRHIRRCRVAQPPANGLWSRRDKDKKLGLSSYRKSLPRVVSHLLNKLGLKPKLRGF